jgi:hypothetical protein
MDPDVASVEPSFALWDLGRMVAADPALTALFDEGGGITRQVGDDEDAIGVDPFVLVGFFVGGAKNAFELINSHAGILPDPPGDSRLTP